MKMKIFIYISFKNTKEKIKKNKKKVLFDKSEGHDTNS